MTVITVVNFPNENARIGESSTLLAPVLWTSTNSLISGKISSLTLKYFDEKKNWLAYLTITENIQEAK